jgi:hypothetical protein
LPCSTEDIVSGAGQQHTENEEGDEDDDDKILLPYGHGASAKRKMISTDFGDNDDVGDDRFQDDDEKNDVNNDPVAINVSGKFVMFLLLYDLL